MATHVIVPHAAITVGNHGDVEAFLKPDGSNAEFPQLMVQLRMPSTLDPTHGQCVITTSNPLVMWLVPPLFYRLLFTIYQPGDEPAMKRETGRYEVRVFFDRLEICEDWNATGVFPILATVRYHETKEFDARPLFEHYNRLG